MIWSEGIPFLKTSYIPFNDDAIENIVSSIPSTALNIGHILFANCLIFPEAILLLTDASKLVLKSFILLISNSNFLIKFGTFFSFYFCYIDKMSFITHINDRMNTKYITKCCAHI